jgi:SAM-dependent methyltransferase
LNPVLARGAEARVPGSFRDPSGYVFLHGERVFRAVDAACRDTLRQLETAGVLPRLVEAGTVVATRTVADPALLGELAGRHGARAAFLEHERISPISYPYEWSVSMIADAGILTLDLQIALLQAGYSLKDATAYNVQFVDGSPRFIDVGSFEAPQRRDLWYALGQFQRMFVYPLLLCSQRGWDPRSYFLANLDGRDVEQVARGFGRLQLWRPSLLLDLTLPLWFERRAARRARAAATGGNGAGAPAGAAGNPGAQLGNLRRLRAKLKRLAERYVPREAWVGYTSECSYDDAAEAAKKGLVRSFIEATRPASVLDLGSNTGDYALIAAGCGARVVAVDQSHDVVEVLYRRLRRERAAITPLVVDLRNPSPGIGYCNEERTPFFERVSADCVLALALLHHLAVSGNLSLEAVRDMLLRVTRRHLVLEYVPPDDEMFRRLTRFRSDDFAHLTLDACRQAFSQGFELEREQRLPQLGRTLLFLRRKGV